MTEDHPGNSHKKASLSAFIWGGTALVASAIIGFSVYVALHNRQPPVEEVPAITGQVQQPLAPMPEPASSEPETENIPAAVPPVAEQEPAPAPRFDEEAAVPEGPPRLQLDNLAGALRLSVPFLEIRDKMPLMYTCYRNNISPAMNWSNAPPETQSYVVFLEKRDAGKDEAFVNWILFNIPAEETGLDEGLPRDLRLPNGAQHANSDHNNTGYIGPCDPKGRHIYALRVFALDTMLDVKPGVAKYDLIRAMNGHIIDAHEQLFTHYYRL